MGLPRLDSLSPAFPARLVVMALVVLASACGDSSTVDDGRDAAPGQSDMYTLTGDITIEGAFELSHIPASQVVVQLQDISLQDAAAVVIAEQVYEGVTTLPLMYELMWNSGLDPRNDYSVSAGVYDESGELIFVTDTVFPVFPGDTVVDFHVISVYVR